jgi:hypothetical protein
MHNLSLLPSSNEEIIRKGCDYLGKDYKKRGKGTEKTRGA